MKQVYATFKSMDAMTLSIIIEKVTVSITACIILTLDAEC
jgi:hypothetical protein